MEQYISKSAVVAEIERRIESLNKDRDFNYLQIKELEALLSSINTLEVKEIDLEKKEIIDKACWWLNNNRLGVIDDDYIKEFRKAMED